MGNPLQDLRYAARRLARSPGFTAMAVLTLALGIGGTTTIFSVVSALLLRPLPVEEADRLVRLEPAGVTPGGELVYAPAWTYADYEDYAALGTIFSGLAARLDRGLLYRHQDEVVRLRAHTVTGNYFHVLGVPPVLGRTLQPADDRSDEPANVAVISRETWQRYFNSDPAAVGSTIDLNGWAFTVVGVVESRAVFRAIGDPEVWMPIHAFATHNPEIGRLLGQRGIAIIPEVIGKLRPGVSREQAQAAVDVTRQRLAEAYPETHQSRAPQVRRADTLQGFSLSPERAGTLRFASILLLLVVGTVLLIAAANVANLLLVRTMGRRHELGIRTALGAGRARVAGELLTESLLLSLLAATGAVAIAMGGLRLAEAIPEVGALSPGLDLRVLGFNYGVAVVAGILCGLAPALLTTSGELMKALRGGVTATRRLRIQGFLIVGQIALTLVLVVAGGLVLRTVKNLVDTDLGFDPAQLIVANVSVPTEAASQLLDEVRALPGVAEAGLSTSPALGGGRLTYGLRIPGSEAAGGDPPWANLATVDDDYFRTVRTPLLRGADFQSLAPGATREVLINETMARRYWPATGALGEQFIVAGDTAVVIGVVADFQYTAIGDEPAPMVFFRYPRMAGGGFTLHVRAERNAAALMAPLRDMLRSANPNVPTPEIRLMAEQVRSSIFEPRIIATFFSLLGGLAVLLAAVGLYGVLAFSVVQRHREIGIRMALGADMGRVAGGVLRDSGRLVALGVAIGLVLASGATRLIAGVLYGVEPTDGMTFLLSTVVLGGVGALAAYLPARRAARVDPIIALRTE